MLPIKNKLKQLEQSIGYQFTDKGLLRQALTHRSFGATNNERFEFLGDALLSLIIAKKLFEQFSLAQEGNLSNLRASLVKGETLAQVAKEFSLGEYLVMGDGELKTGGQQKTSILADALEAIIAAIFLDSDLSQVHHIVEAWFASRLRALDSNINAKDNKTQLQEWLQSKKQPLPEYTVVTIDGADHQQQFTVSCKVSLLDEEVLAQAGSRQKAEKQVAKMVLDKLRENTL